MKKIYLLLPLVSLLLGCSSEPIQSDENFETLSLEAEVEFPGMDLMGVVSWELINAKNGKTKGWAYVGNDCDNLYVLIQGAEEGNLGLYNEGDFPARNGNKETVSPEQENYLNGQPLMWTFDLNKFQSEGVNIFINAGGHSWGGDLSWGTAKYFYYEFQLDNCSEEVCTGGKGYWWNHGSNGNPGNQNNEWPAKVMEEGLELGEGTYSVEILGQIYDRNTAGGNGLVSVAHHLITAKLNIANGTDPSAVADAIEEADEFIGILNPLEDKKPQGEVGNFKDILEAYNEGEIGPGNCETK